MSMNMNLFMFISHVIRSYVLKMLLDITQFDTIKTVLYRS